MAAGRKTEHVLNLPEYICHRGWCRRGLATMGSLPFEPIRHRLLQILKNRFEPFSLAFLHRLMISLHFWLIFWVLNHRQKHYDTTKVLSDIQETYKPEDFTSTQTFSLVLSVESLLFGDFPK